MFGDGGKGWNIDHIVPVFKGGMTTRTNLQVLCRDCHTKKTAPEIMEIRQSKPNTSWREWMTHAEKDEVIERLRVENEDLKRRLGE